MMQTQKQQQIQILEQHQKQTVVSGPQVSGSLSLNAILTAPTSTGDEDQDQISRSALSAFRAKEEEIERKKMEVRERVQAQLGRVEEESKRLAMIREELEQLADPTRKEVSVVRKKIDTVNKELKPMGVTVQKKEKEYKDALDAFNEKNKEKAQLVNRLVELVSEGERFRMKKLEELSKTIESMR